LKQSIRSYEDRGKQQQEFRVVHRDIETAKSWAYNIADSS